MSERKWTPGPWSIRRSADNTPLVAVDVPVSEGSGFGVAHINRLPRMGSVRGCMDANAHLIAAAPELYEALKLWQASDEETVDGAAQVARQIAREKRDAALARAEGRDQ